MTLCLLMILVLWRTEAKSGGGSYIYDSRHSSPISLSQGGSSSLLPTHDLLDYDASPDYVSPVLPPSPRPSLTFDPVVSSSGLSASPLVSRVPVYTTPRTTPSTLYYYSPSSPS